MPHNGFACKQCGHCCLNMEAYYSNATETDIAMWEENGRHDIIEWVDPVNNDIWISPRTGDDVNRCPWLRKLPRQEKYICRIQDVKPELCRNFPLSRKHAEETGCSGFN